MKRENKGLREKIKGTSAKEEKQNLGWKIQGADSVKGEIGKKDYGRNANRHRNTGGKIVKGRNKRCS